MRKCRCFRPRYRVGDTARVRFCKRSMRGGYGPPQRARCVGYRWKRNPAKAAYGGKWVAVWRRFLKRRGRGDAIRRRRWRR